MKRWQTVLLGIVVSVATLAYALNGVDFRALGAEFVAGNYLFVLPAFAFVVLGLALRAMRWRALLNDRMAFIHSFHILNIGQFLNSILPLRLGEVTRGFLATRLNPPISVFTALSTVVVERLVDVIAVVVLIVVALLIAPITREIETAARVSGTLSIIGLVVLALFAARPSLAHTLLNLVLRIIPALERFHLRNLAERVLDGIAPLGSLRGAALTIFWSALAWISSVVTTFILMSVFYERPTWNAALLMTSIASLAIALPAVPGSVGPFEAAMVLGLTVGGMVEPNNPQQQARAVACSVLIHIVSTGSYAFLGVIGLGQERISFGEVLRSVRQLASRQAAPSKAET
jgi:glycosyltransferase 2 family protein